MSTVFKVLITLAAFLVAVAISSFALASFSGHSYPAWTVAAALMMVSPAVFIIWRDRLT